jgi:hypothetical protein
MSHNFAFLPDLKSNDHRGGAIAAQLVHQQAIKGMGR